MVQGKKVEKENKKQKKHFYQYCCDIINFCGPWLDL